VSGSHERRQSLVFHRNVFYCLDTETGSELWRYPSKGTIQSTIRTSPVVADGRS